MLDHVSTRTWTLHNELASNVRGVGLRIMLLFLEEYETVQAVQ